MITPLRRWAALLLACTGCASYEAEPLVPAVEHEKLAGRVTATALAPPPATSLGAETFPVAARVDAADGLALEEANALALFHAPPLVAARAELRLKGAELLRAGLLPNPELFVGPRIATEGSGLIFPASLAFAVPLDGRLGADERRAAEEVSAARARLLDAEAATLVELRRRFIRIAALERRRSVLREVAEASARAAAAAEELVRSGEADRVALGLAVLDRDEAAQALARLEQDHAEARLDLFAAIGVLPDAGLPLEVPPQVLEPQALPEPDAAVRLRHLRLQALEAAYRAAEHALEGEVDRQYPSVRIGPEFESAGGEPSFGVGLSLTLPLFDANAGGIAVAREGRTAVREAWHAAALDLAHREARARTRHATAAALLAALRQDTLPAADLAARALEARRLRGETTLVETLAARSAIARARLREIDMLEEAALQALDVLWYAGALFPVPGEGVVDRDGATEGRR